MTYGPFILPPLDGFMGLVSRKRMPFSYEKEHRIVGINAVRYEATHETIERPPGYALPWDPDEHVERVLLHPGADASTLVAVKAVVEASAPKLLDRVVPSAMPELPPT